MIKNYFYMCHPAVVLLYFFGVIVFSMVASGPVLTAVSFLCAWICRSYARGIGAFLSSLKISLPVIILFTTINPFLNTRGLTVLFVVLGRSVTAESLLYGFASGMMLASIMLWFALLNDMGVSDSILTVFSRFIPTTALALTMILRYIPHLIKNANDVQNVYSANSPSSERQKTRIKGALRTTTVVLEKSLEDSIETAKSMHARMFRAGKKKTSMQSFSKSDKAYLVLVLILLCLCIIARIFGGKFLFFPYLELPKYTFLTAAFSAVFMLIPVLSDGKDELKCLVCK